MAFGYMPDIPTDPNGQSEPELSSDELSYIEQFKQRIAEFTTVFDRLKSIEPQIQKHPDLKPEYDDLVTRGGYIERTIDATTNAINKALQWVKAAIGIDGLGAARSGQLGALPLIPIAAITGALALIGKWISDVYIFNQKLQKFDELIKSGMSPQDAADTLTKATTKPPLISVDLKKWIIPAIIVGGLWWWNRKRSL